MSNIIFEKYSLFESQHRGPWHCQYRIPNFIVSKRGTVFLLPEERVNSIADEAKHHLVLRRSFDSGKTWSDMDVLFADDNPRVSHSYNGGVADLETGRVFVFFIVEVAIGPNDIGGNWPEQWKVEHTEEAEALRKRFAPHVNTGLYMVWSDDEGENWSQPQSLGDKLNVTNPVTGEQRVFVTQFSGIQLRHGLHAGRLLMPGRGFSKGSPFALYAYSHNYIVYSDDHGVTWQPGGLTQTGTGEACMVELSDGALYVNSRNESLRCRGYRAWDISYDGGVTFTRSGYDIGLPEPHCAASMARYSEMPNRILFCNPSIHSTTNSHYDHLARRNLTIRMSEDDCHTWSVSRTVCEGPSGYSALAVTPDGTILCAYETLDSTSYTGTIEVIRCNMSWLMNR